LSNLVELNNLLMDTFYQIQELEEKEIRNANNDSLSYTEVHTLQTIKNFKSGTMSQIASALKITTSTLTIAVNRLEEKGFVNRIRIDNDKRMVRVILTEYGKKTIVRHETFHHMLCSDIINNLDNQSIDTFTRAMDNLAAFYYHEGQKFN
jgi:Transcriptional regulators